MDTETLKSYISYGGPQNETHNWIPRLLRVKRLKKCPLTPLCLAECWHCFVGFPVYMQVLCSFLTRPHPDCGEGTIRLSRQLTAPLSSLVFCRCRSSYLLSRSYPLRLLGAASFKTTECSFLNLQQGSNPLLRNFCVKSCPYMYNVFKIWDVASTLNLLYCLKKMTVEQLLPSVLPPSNHLFPKSSTVHQLTISALTQDTTC